MAHERKARETGKAMFKQQIKLICACFIVIGEPEIDATLVRQRAMCLAADTYLTREHEKRNICSSSKQKQTHDVVFPYCEQDGGKKESE